MFEGMGFFGCYGSMDLRIPESEFSNRSLHSTLGRFRGKNYVDKVKFLVL
jgi:hypothetical protein